MQVGAGRPVVRLAATVRTPTASGSSASMDRHPRRRSRWTYAFARRRRLDIPARTRRQGGPAACAKDPCFASCATGRVAGYPGIMSDPIRALLFRGCRARRTACWQPDPRRPPSAPDCRSHDRAAIGLDARVAARDEDRAFRRQRQDCRSRPRTREPGAGPAALLLRNRRNTTLGHGPALRAARNAGAPLTTRDRSSRIGRAAATASHLKSSAPQPDWADASMGPTSHSGLGSNLGAAVAGRNGASKGNFRRSISTIVAHGLRASRPCSAGASRAITATGPMALESCHERPSQTRAENYAPISRPCSMRVARARTCRRPATCLRSPPTATPGRSRLGDRVTTPHTKRVSQARPNRRGAHARPHERSEADGTFPSRQSVRLTAIHGTHR